VFTEVNRKNEESAALHCTVLYSLAVWRGHRAPGLRGTKFVFVATIESLLSKGGVSILRY